MLRLISSNVSGSPLGRELILMRVFPRDLWRGWRGIAPAGRCKVRSLPQVRQEVRTCVGLSLDQACVRCPSSPSCFRQQPPRCQQSWMAMQPQTYCPLQNCQSTLRYLLLCNLKRPMNRVRQAMAMWHLLQR